MSFSLIDGCSARGPTVNDCRGDIRDIDIFDSVSRWLYHGSMADCINAFPDEPWVQCGWERDEWEDKGHPLVKVRTPLDLDLKAFVVAVVDGLKKVEAAGLLPKSAPVVCDFHEWWQFGLVWEHSYGPFRQWPQTAHNVKGRDLGLAMLGAVRTATSRDRVRNPLCMYDAPYLDPAADNTQAMRAVYGRLDWWTPTVYPDQSLSLRAWDARMAQAVAYCRNLDAAKPVYPVVGYARYAPHGLLPPDEMVVAVRAAKENGADGAMVWARDDSGAGEIIDQWREHFAFPLAAMLNRG